MKNVKLIHFLNFGKNTRNITLLCALATINNTIYAESNNVPISTGQITFKNLKTVQQQIIVSGRVTDNNGNPMTGVSVAEKGKPSEQITGQDGKYQIKVASAGTLVFTFVGYETVEIHIQGKDVVNVNMRSNIKDLDEVVIIGYTSQKKSLLTGAVATMKIDDNLKTLPTTSAGNMLIGKLAGVNVNTVDAVPGAQPNVSIRTGSSWNKQNVTYVIDGVVRGGGDFNNLSPNEIEDISVLKDAASAAIYGSRSAGGVIIVTTKKGTRGKPTFNFSSGYSIDTRTKNVALTSAVQAGELYGRINGSADPAGWAWSQEEIDHYKTINNGWGYDQLETVWQNPTTQTNNLSVDGGNDRVRYFGAASYVKQKGFLEPMTYDKYNIRMNVTADITKDLEIFTGFALYNNLTSSIADNADPADTYGKLRVWQPDQPVFTDNGQFVDYGWIGNVGARVMGASGYNKENHLKPQLIVSGTYRMPFLKGLSAKAMYSRSWTNNIRKRFYTNYDMMVMKRSGANNRIVSTDDNDIINVKRSTWVGKDYIERKSTWSDDKQFNMQLNYENVFNDKHRVSAALVTEWAEGAGSGVTGGRETFPVYKTDQFWAASGDRVDTWGDGDTDWMNGRMSYIGQFNYTYADKYLFNFSFREDGSMKFAPEQRWGFFPAGSVGWVISEENFFNKSIVQLLKFRGSVGLTGHDEVGGWQWLESYKPGKNVYFGTSPISSVGITYGNIVNRNLTWEKALSYNIGVDMSMFKNWNLSADYWIRNSYDILGDRQNALPSTFSLSMPAENYGQIAAQGIDLQLGYRNSSEKVQYFANLTMSYGWNKVIKRDYPENAQWIDIPIGKPVEVKDQAVDYIKGWEFDRILRTQADLDAFNAANPNYKHNGLSPELGMMVYKDRSGPNGVVDGVIDNWDRVELVKGNFPVVYGLNLGISWKGFHLETMLSGRLGEKKWMSDLAGGVEWNRMWDQWYSDSWTPENPNATLPKRVGANNAKTYETKSTFWLKDASFMRMKYLTLSYDLPKGNAFYNKIFSNVRVFATGTNLFVLSKFNKYYDPEIGGGNSFPILRSYNFGIDVKF
ncbi:SusC/RagA family TonB-linked outer membrane protein [Sphingobacterium sp. UDSM-2020]|uniref:SusC/RagA family TonB-linked outer membrane protein n=1 Tax=Sphingobacterium sp. UDSM-2020 TaxID=2795738 RepID=UPI001936EAB7|nr:SusC/RagA family TonB-linked outer membrane protein [Sphingobacterium sp. UDSM-2020]QQD11660.1 SusC/RagA family TonB-linked outer membrane protein [Sphingobacterium sp. UDSM-2020]